MPAIKKNGKEMTMIPRLIILRGSPGVGKSTVSKSINKINSASKKTYISVDAMQHLDLRPQSKNKEKLGIKNSAVLSASFLEEGFDVVLDYVFDDVDDIENVLKIIRSSIGENEFFVQKFYLDAPLEKVLKRNQSRSGKKGEYMNTALLKKLYAKVDATKGTVPNEVIINTTPLSAKQSARMIISFGKGLLNGVDSMTLSLPEEDRNRALENDD